MTPEDFKKGLIKLFEPNTPDEDFDYDYLLKRAWALEQSVRISKAQMEKVEEMYVTVGTSLTSCVKVRKALEQENQFLRDKINSLE